MLMKYMVEIFLLKKTLTKEIRKNIKLFMVQSLCVYNKTSSFKKCNLRITKLLPIFSLQEIDFTA